MRVEIRECLHNDRHGQVDDQHTSDSRDGTEEQSDDRSRHDITETERTDRTRGKPEPIDDRDHLVVRWIAQTFDIVHRWTGNHHRQKEEEQQETQDTGRVRDRSDDHFQAWMKITEFEHSRYTNRRDQIQSSMITIESKGIVQYIGRAEPECAQKICPSEEEIFISETRVPISYRSNSRWTHKTLVSTERQQISVWSRR